MTIAKTTVELPDGGLTQKQISRAFLSLLAAGGNQDAYRVNVSYDDGRFVNFGHARIKGAPCHILVVPSKEREFFKPQELVRKIVVISHGDKSVHSHNKQNEIIDYVIEFAGKLQEACNQLTSADTDESDDNSAEDLD